MNKKYNITIFASYIGYIVQAIVNNLTPLLYVQFSNEFSFAKWQITLIIVVNFAIQILIDYFSSKFAIKLGYRKCTLIAHSLSLVGLILLGVLPYLISPFIGIVISVLFMAIGGGFIEVVVSPIVDALPSNNKSGTMSLLHSFYSWGHILVVLLATGFFYFIGIEHWKYLPFIFVIFPLLNLFLFAICPLEQQKGDETPLSVKGVFKQKYFIFLLQ